jgi:hypothetical protein
MSVLIGAERAARKLGAPLIVDLRDPWTGYPGEDARALRTRVSAALEARTLTSAAKIVCTTPGLAAGLAKRFPHFRERLHVITNGYDHAPRQLPNDTGHRLGILFAGEIYANRDPFPFLAAVDRLVNRPEVNRERITVKLVGRCESFRGQSLARWMEGKRCREVVQILPPVAPQAVPDLVAEATVLLNLAHHQMLQVPAKTFEHLVSGRELLILCEAESDTAGVVRGIPGVVQVDPDDAAAVDAALLDLYERHVGGGKLTAPGGEALESFSRASLNARYADLLRAACPRLDWRRGAD